MEKLFVIEARYETFTKDGKNFVPWYIYKSDQYNEVNGKEAIKELKKSAKDIDKLTKLKHEFRLLPLEEYQENLNQIKQQIIDNKQAYIAYKSSDKYKEIQKKKRQAAKERKERQKKYLEEHQD